MSSPANAATALARTVVDELVRGGVQDLVLSPGSRSAALAYAAHAAEGLRLHTRIDERTAGFLALGIARTSRRPAAVVTTSGTAVANLHPATLEASHSGLPLVLLTADRPADLRGTGANQTTEQAAVFGGAVRFSADMPSPTPGHREQGQVRSWRATTSRALLAATGAAAAPGPVHLNLQMDAPLTPDQPDGWSADVEGRPGAVPWTQAPAAAEHPWEDVASDRRTVVIAGDDAGPPARVLAETAGWPLLAEPTSGSRTGANAIRTYRLLLDDAGLADRVERVIVCGHPTLGRPLLRLMSRTDVEVVAVPSRAGTWTDPGHAAARVVRRPLATPEPPSYPTEVPESSPWLQEWLDRDAEVGAKLDELLDGWAELTPHHVAGALAEALPPRGLLFVGASNPVRDLDLMVPRYRVGDRRMTIGNRGLAGIDGSVSSAVGAALGRPRSSRSFAMLGDVTFLHDLTGLVIGPDDVRPDLTIVVVNDDGGSIFASLEQGSPDLADSYERLFGTPHGVDLSGACASVGVVHRRVTDRAELGSAIAVEPRGIEVVEAVVRRDDRRDLDRAIRALASG